MHHGILAPVEEVLDEYDEPSVRRYHETAAHGVCDVPLIRYGLSAIARAVYHIVEGFFHYIIHYHLVDIYASVKEGGEFGVYDDSQSGGVVKYVQHHLFDCPAHNYLFLVGYCRGRVKRPLSA